MTRLLIAILLSLWILAPHPSAVAFAAPPTHNAVICPACGGGTLTTVSGPQIFTDGGPLSGINGDPTSMKVTISGSWVWGGGSAAYYSGPGCSAQTYNGVGGGITGSAHTATNTMITFICYATETTPGYTHKLKIILYGFGNGTSAIVSQYLS